MYPIQLDLSKKHAVLVGGGRIGYRKFKQLAKANCGDVTVISKSFCQNFLKSLTPI